MRWKNKEMEIRINGEEEAPSIRLRIGLIALIQVFVGMVTFGVAMKVAQADIERLQKGQEKFESKVDHMLDSQRRMESTLESLRDELRYYREKLDRHIEAGAARPARSLILESIPTAAEIAKEGKER